MNKTQAERFLHIVSHMDGFTWGYNHQDMEYTHNMCYGYLGMSNDESYLLEVEVFKFNEKKYGFSCHVAERFDYTDASGKESTEYHAVDGLYFHHTTDIEDASNNFAKALAGYMQLKENK